MSRPLNKAQLTAAIQKEYSSLEKYLAPLTPEQLAFSAAFGIWAVKDILAHLYAWQQMLFNWYETGLRGETPALPAPGYKWNQLPALNQQIYEKYCTLISEQALELFRESHQNTLQWIETLAETDLITPGLFPWMNNNTLMAYLNSVTAAHYVWALKEAKKVLKDHSLSAIG
jgi:hypothetical protein